MNSNKNILRSGQMLVVTVFVILIFSILGIVVASMLAGESFSTVQNIYGIQALNVAEGGTRYAVVASLAADSDWSNNVDFGPIDLGAGSFTVRYIYKTMKSVTLEVTGAVGGVSRTIRSGFNKGSLDTAFDQYAIFMGGGNGATIGNSSTIGGDVFIYGNLAMGNGTTITGDATATGTITGGSVLGTQDTNAPPATTSPSLETSYYNDQVSIANTNPNYTGNRTFGGALAPGAYYVKGNVTLDSLTLTGVTTIVATGTIFVGNGKTIGDNFTAIAAGAITIGNSSNLGESGLWYSSTSITIGNSGDVADVTSGSGTAFITPGNFSSGNTFNANGLIYAGGSFVVGNTFKYTGTIVSDHVTIGNTASISINPAVISLDAIPGLTAGGLTKAGPVNVVGWEDVY